MGQQFNTSTEWHTAPGTDDGAIWGRNANSKVAAFGGVPAPQPVIPASPTAEQIATALASLNLVKLSG